MKRLKPSVAGIFRYSTAKGLERWAVDWAEPTGRKRRKAGFATREKAVAFRDSVESRRERGHETGVKLSKAISEHKADRLLEGRKKASYQYLEAWAMELGTLTLEEIRPEQIEAVLRRWMAPPRKLSPASRNRALAQLSAVFTSAIRRRWLDRHPIRASYLEHLTEPPGRTRWLRKEELRALFRACPAWLENICRWAVCTGWRLSEICNLRVSEVHEDSTGRLFVEGGPTKSGAPMRWPLEGWPAGYARLRLRREKFHAEHLLPGPGGGNARTSVRRAFPLAVAKAGLIPGRKDPQGVTFHVLRHSMASLALQAGLSEREIVETGRWADPRMLKRYAHLADEARREAAARVAKLVDHPRSRRKVVEAPTVSAETQKHRKKP